MLWLKISAVLTTNAERDILIPRHKYLFISLPQALIEMLKLHHHPLHHTDMEASMYWESEMTRLLVNVVDNCPQFIQACSQNSA